MTRLSMQIVGAHRGARAFTEAFTQEPPPTPLEVLLADPFPGRANTLVPIWQSRGIPAAALQARAADLQSPCNLCLLDMDDIEEQARILSEEPREDILLHAALASAPLTPSDGGVTLGIGGTITHENSPLRRRAADLVGAFASFAGHARTSSRMIRGQYLSRIQVGSTRRVLHHQLADDTRAYLAGRTREHLFFVETLSPAPPFVYPLLALEEAEPGGLHRDLRQRALEIASQDATSPAASVFLRNTSRTWGYLALLRRRGEHSPLQVSRTVEFGSAASGAPTYITD